MKKYLFKNIILLLMVSIIGEITAQETNQTNNYIKNNVTLNVGTTIYQDYGFDNVMFSIDGLYGLNNWFETGLFMTYVNSNVTSEINSKYINTHSFGLYYGLAARSHLLPIFTKQSYHKLDVYANIQIGAKSIIYDKNLRDDLLIKNHTKSFVNGSLGIGYNFNKRIGVFYECGYSNTDRLNHKLGLKLIF